MSNSQLTSLICNHFGGIRRKESSFSDEKITCSDCQNVELYFTNLNSGIGIRVAKGNKSVHTFNDEEIIGLFKSNQGGEEIIFIYTEDGNEGKLYQYHPLYKEYKLIDVSLSATGDACGTDFTQGYSDFFVFSNGKNLVYLYTDNNKLASGVQIYKTKDDNKFYKGFPKSTYSNADGTPITVKGLGLVVFDHRLWIFNGNILYYSYYNMCTDFCTQDTEQTASAGQIEFTKPITAVHEYLGSLAVFHKNSSSLVSQDQTTVYKVGDESPGGCASYNALVFHGTDLYFYDDTKKGVYGFSQVVNGDKVLSQNIADDIQEELMQIGDNLNKIRALSVVTEDRNEVWFILPPIKHNRTQILIFDYIRGEWVKRLSNHINCAMVFNADLYTGGAKLYKEYETNSFDGEFIGAYYTCSIFNYGADNTLKITKFPPRLTVDTSDTCDFFVEYNRNYNLIKKPKTKEIKGKKIGSLLIYDGDSCYDDKFIYNYTTNIIVKMPTTTFKALEISFRTLDEDQNFNIKNIEFSKLKVKQV